MELKTAICQKFKPVCVLYPEEQYKPCHVDWYIRKTALYDAKDKMLMPEGSLNIDNLKDVSESFSDPSNQYLKVNSQNIGGEDDVQNVPFLVRWLETSTCYEPHFIFFYAYNGPFMFGAGLHECDIEHITVRIAKDNPNVVKEVYFSQHGSNEGQWVDAKDLEMFDGTHPICYSAKGSHASYPQKKTWFRVCCFANDHTAEGIHWYPNELVFIDENTPWVYYRGNMGGPSPGHVSACASQSWWNDESDYTCTQYNRCFPCLPRKPC